MSMSAHRQDNVIGFSVGALLTGFIAILIGLIDTLSTGTQYLTQTGERVHYHWQLLQMMTGLGTMVVAIIILLVMAYLES